MVKYLLKIENPRNHLIKVIMTIEQPHPEGQRLSLPNWIPGSYMIRDFAKNIVSITAYSGDKSLAITNLDKSTWQVEASQGKLTIEY